MRKNLGLPLIGLGSLLLMVGIICVTWAPGQAKRTPLDVDTITVLDGTAKKLDSSTGELVETPVKAYSVTKVDSEVSDGDVVVWQQYSCLMVDDGNLPAAPNCLQYDDPRAITAPEPEFFATDRRTAEAVDNAGYLPDSTPQIEGTANKWPFDAEKKDYTYWDATMGAAVPAVYDRTETIDGIETYVYVVTIEDAEIVSNDLPMIYDDVKTIFVEPRTGAVIDQREDQQRYLADSGDVALDLQLGFTDEQVSQNVADAKDNIGTLNLMTRWAPILGFVLGGIFLAAGAYLLFGSGSTGGSRGSRASDDAPSSERKPSLAKS